MFGLQWLPGGDLAVLQKRLEKESKLSGYLEPRAEIWQELGSTIAKNRRWLGQIESGQTKEYAAELNLESTRQKNGFARWKAEENLSSTVESLNLKRSLIQQSSQMKRDYERTAYDTKLNQLNMSYREKYAALNASNDTELRQSNNNLFKLRIPNLLGIFGGGY